MEGMAACAASQFHRQFHRQCSHHNTANASFATTVVPDLHGLSASLVLIDLSKNKFKHMVTHTRILHSLTNLNLRMGGLRSNVTLDPVALDPLLD